MEREVQRKCHFRLEDKELALGRGCYEEEAVWAKALRREEPTVSKDVKGGQCVWIKGKEKEGASS